MTTQEIWKDRIILFLLEWMKAAEDAGQSPAPISFGVLIEDDITLRHALRIAGRGSKAKV